MRIAFTITFNDGSAAEAVASVADQVAFEDANDRSIARLADDFRLRDACWLAWHAQHRTGKTALDFEAWLDTVDSVEFGTAAVVPLEEPTQPTG